MNQEVIDFLLGNDFVYLNSDTEQGYIRLFKMCPCCGKIWSAFVEIDGNFQVANDFGHVCWDTKSLGYSDLNFNKYSTRKPLYFNGIKHIELNALETVEDAKLLIDFVNSYKPK